MHREMEVVWNGVKMGRFLFTPPRVFTVCMYQFGSDGGRLWAIVGDGGRRWATVGDG
jgi:hypothetical protein